MLSFFNLNSQVLFTEESGSDRWNVRTHPDWAPVFIHVHCSFRRTWTNPVEQCDFPYFQNCYRLASGTLRVFWVYTPPLAIMSIIMHIWDGLQRALERSSPSPCTLMDLWRALQAAWCHFHPSLLQKLVKSMPRRIAALMRARGALYSVTVSLALQCIWRDYNIGLQNRWKKPLVRDQPMIFPGNVEKNS